MSDHKERLEQMASSPYYSVVRPQIRWALGRIAELEAQVQEQRTTLQTQAGYVRECEKRLDEQAATIERLMQVIMLGWRCSPDPRGNGRFVCGDPHDSWPQCVRGEGATEDEAIRAALAAQDSQEVAG